MLFRSNRTTLPGSVVNAALPILNYLPSPTVPNAGTVMFDGNGGIIKLDVANLASSDQALVTPSSGTQQNAGLPFSLEAWVYIPTGPSQTINIASKSALGGVYNYLNSGWRLWAAGADLYFHVGYDARVVAYSALTAGSWNHIVATYNGSYGSFASGAISMYVNAQAQTLSYNNGSYCYNTTNG